MGGTRWFSLSGDEESPGIEIPSDMNAEGAVSFVEAVWESANPSGEVVSMDYDASTGDLTVTDE